MKNNYKKISLIITAIFIFLFTLRSNVIALTLVEPESGNVKRGDAISFTTLKSNNFTRVALNYEENSHFVFKEGIDYTVDEGEPEDTTKKITLDTKITKYLKAPNTYVAKAYATEEEMMLGNVLLESESFLIEPMRNDYNVTFTPQQPKEGDVITFTINAFCYDILNIFINNVKLSEIDDCIIDIVDDNTTNIKLKESYVNEKLPSGDYVATIETYDGYVKTSFKVEKKEVPKPDTGQPELNPSEYKVIEVWNDVFVVGRPIVLKTNMPVNRFDSILIDNKPVVNKTYNEKYTIESRDNVIVLVLTEKITKDLKPHVEHILEINSNNGGVIKYKFTLKENYKMLDEPKNPETKQDFVFRSEGDVKDLIAVYVDGKLLKKDVDYEVSSGSIVIKLLEAFLKKLKPGETYIINIETTKGIASAEFTMPKTLKAVNNPDTGDNIVIIASLSLIVLVTSLFIIKRIQKKENI